MKRPTKTPPPAQGHREPEAGNAAATNRAGTFRPTGHTVSVPEKIRPLFEEAQRTVGEYFSRLTFNPTHGTIEIQDERYVLVRASALSHDFLTTVQQLYADRGAQEALAIGKDFLFDIAHVIGVNDARRFQQEMHLTEPIAKLAAGPVHFAYSGWAFVEILPESNPTPDSGFFLLYRHPYSFEADSWIRARKKSKTPVCVMNAGYSSGWCEESFGLPLTAVEVTCKAKGDPHCTFLMAPPHRIQEHLAQYTRQTARPAAKKPKYDIPTFFERKKLEEQLALYALIVESTEDAILSIDLEGNITTWNRGAQKLYGYSEKEALGRPISMLVPPALLNEETQMQEKIRNGETVAQFETERRRKNGKVFPISLTVSAIKDQQGRTVGVAKIAHDISKRKKAEAALKDLNNSLEKLVQERTSDLQRAYEQLETRVTFRNLELEKQNKANLARIKALEQEIARLNT